MTCLDKPKRLKFSVKSNRLKVNRELENLAEGSKPNQRSILGPSSGACVCEDKKAQGVHPPLNRKEGCRWRQLGPVCMPEEGKLVPVGVGRALAVRMARSHAAQGGDPRVEKKCGATPPPPPLNYLSNQYTPSP